MTLPRFTIENRFFQIIVFCFGFCFVIESNLEHVYLIQIIIDNDYHKTYLRDKVVFQTNFAFIEKLK